jgi:hypothetical protein
MNASPSDRHRQVAYDDASILKQVASLNLMDSAKLKSLWSDLFDEEAPPYNRRFLESRLAYRIQELAFGGLSSAAERQLANLGNALQENRPLRRQREHRRPITGTRLVREWQGVEHTVTVTANGYEYGGRPYRSLSAVARSITGTRWNGWIFFGLKNIRGGQK